MSNIEIKKIVKSIETSDGAGVKLKRSIGTPEADYIDPFLMLDEFGSENKDDYVAGFPPHPHRVAYPSPRALLSDHAQASCGLEVILEVLVVHL